MQPINWTENTGSPGIQINVISFFSEIFSVNSSSVLDASLYQYSDQYWRRRAIAVAVTKRKYHQSSFLQFLHFSFNHFHVIVIFLSLFAGQRVEVEVRDYWMRMTWPSGISLGSCHPADGHSLSSRVAFCVYSHFLHISASVGKWLAGHRCSQTHEKLWSWLVKYLRLSTDVSGTRLI